MAPRLHSVVAELERSAPLRLAEAWDNVGLLVDPHADDAPCERLLLTVDLTWSVLQEALQRRAMLVLSYHPVIFGGLKRLRVSVPGERIVIEALRHGVAVYSPHTALDAVAGGMTDWLASALGSGSSDAIVPAVSAPERDPSSERSNVEPRVEGQGRLVHLDVPLGVDAAVEAVKKHLGLQWVRLASSQRHAQGELVRTLAVCPGAGGSVFERVGDVDLLLTGEMRHHDVLARNARGASVILCDHTNTERGFLPIYGERLRACLPGVEVLVSSEDRDPLSVT